MTPGFLDCEKGMGATGNGGHEGIRCSDAFRFEWVELELSLNSL